MILYLILLVLLGIAFGDPGAWIAWGVLGPLCVLLAISIPWRGWAVIFVAVFLLLGYWRVI